MIPSTFGALLAFLGLVAPGITFDLVTERRRPRASSTAFREISRVALASFGFTLVAIALLVLLRLKARAAVPDVPQWITQGNQYIARHPVAVFGGLGIEVVAACALAMLTGWFVTRKSESSISNHGVWYEALRNDRPPHSLAWLHVRLDDETEFWGYLRHYTQEDNAAVRDIVLGGAQMLWRRKDDETRSLIGPSWDAVCINADRIRYMRVIYSNMAGNRWYGRKTPEHPDGEPRPNLSVQVVPVPAPPATPSMSAGGQQPNHETAAD